MGNLVFGTAAVAASPRPNRGWRKPAMPVDCSTASSVFQNAPQAANMSEYMRTVIEKLYNDLKGDDDRLSRDKFAAFLRDVQGEEIVPLDRTSYAFGEFFYSWITIYSRAIRSPDTKDLSKPLTNYFINSSHNTYVSSNQLLTKSSPQEYINTLKRGCRCIEIDVWNCDTFVSTSQKSSGADHTRSASRISGSSLPYWAKDVADTVEDFNKNWLGGNSQSTDSSTTVSGAGRGLNDDGDVSPKASSASLSEAKDTMEKLDEPGHHSSQQSRHQPQPPPSRPRSHSKSSMPPGEPIVTHGWTLCVPCGFREVCVAVRESAFVNGNDLPIIVSLEVHANAEQQEVMVKIMKEEWAGYLVERAHEGCDPSFSVPTLQEMRRKILVKVKKAPNKLSQIPGQNVVGSLAAMTTASSIDDDSSDSDDDRSTLANGTNINALPPARRRQQLQTPSFPICQSLSDLAVYTFSAKYQGFERPEAKKRAHMFSISESKIPDINEKHHVEMFRHNKSCFMRIYPRGRRIRSSNPDPSICWSKGVQMVAMNWQYMCDKMMLNEAMFADEQGYVLKPPGYLSTDNETSPEHTQDDASPGITWDMTMTVFAAHHLPTGSHDDGETGSGRNPSDLRPVVKAELVVEEVDDNNKKHTSMHVHTVKRQTSHGKTDHPEFGGGKSSKDTNSSLSTDSDASDSESHEQGGSIRSMGTDLVFGPLNKVVPQLSFLRIRIEDEGLGLGKSKLLAWACVRLDRLRKGYRFIPLRDTKGNPIDGGRLLVKIDIR